MLRRSSESTSREDYAVGASVASEGFDVKIVGDWCD